MKILFITNKVKTFNKGFQNDFDPLLKLGHEIFWGANFTGFIGNTDDIPATVINLPITSNPFNLGNAKAYRSLVKSVLEYKIDVILCSTPIGGFLGRLVAKRTKTKVIYAAHGLLFFKGASFLNNTVYKMQEVLMAKWTDVFIAINNEDYSALSNIKKKKGSKLYLVHGAGVDVDKDKYLAFDANTKRNGLMIPAESYLITSIGFLNKNKNYKVVIEAIALLKKQLDIHYIICGEGKEQKNLESLASRLGIRNNIHFLGYRTDVFEIIKASDVVIVPSFREGVPRVVLEAMNLGIPCIGSDTRGIRELIGKDQSEFLCNPKSPKAFSEAILFAKNNPDYCKRIVERNLNEAKQYESEVVRKELYEIFKANI